MKILIISDIHANYEALKAIQDVCENVDKIICLGDFVGYYCQVNETLDLIRQWKPLCLLGNHDFFLINSCPPAAPASVRFGIEYARRTISSDHLAWLSELPLTWGGFIDKHSFLFFHGSPWKPLTDYLYEDDLSTSNLACFDYDVIAFGQTHRACMRTGQRPLLINPGSVGQSRNRAGYSCAVLLDTHDMSLINIERAYNVQKVIDLAVKNGAGDWITKHLID